MGTMSERTAGQRVKTKCMECGKKIEFIVAWKKSGKPRMCDECKYEKRRKYNRELMRKRLGVKTCRV